eukprot:1209708-Rhodomonas_salina.1
MRLLGGVPGTPVRLGRYRTAHSTRVARYRKVSTRHGRRTASTARSVPDTAVGPYASSTVRQKVSTAQRHRTIAHST